MNPAQETNAAAQPPVAFDPGAVKIQLPPMSVGVVNILLEGLDQLPGGKSRLLANTIQDLANRTIEQAHAEYQEANAPKPEPQPAAADVGAV